MAVVLPSEERNYFSNSTLRRSHSQPKFGAQTSGSFHESSSASRVHDIYSHPSVKIFSDSVPSSAPSSPRTATASTAELSCSSTPASNLSLSTDCGEPLLRDLDDNDDILLPDYNGYFGTPEELEPPPSPRTGGSYTISPGNESSTTTSRPSTPEFFDYGAVDDTAVGVQPTQHVDYLSHDWREEDIWSSWKYIISNKSDFGNAARLENASWRTWIKAKNKLKTVSPETLNWLKDCDVTWLYGPLQTGNHTMMSSQTDLSNTGLSKSNSFIQSQVQKKPILKKRSMSEVMLQKSLSSSSLVKQAAAAVQAQQKELPRGIRTSARPKFERAATDYVTFPFSSRRMSRDYMSLGPSTSSSGMESPSSERKHIHFNEQVEQCIAVDVKGDEDDEVDSDRYNYDSDSDDGMMMMKRTNSKNRRLTMRRKTCHNDKAENKKSINMLPPTTLKYKDTPEPPENSAMKHSVYRSPVMSPSSSQETLRPAKPSGRFFIDDEDKDDDEDDGDQCFNSGLHSPATSSFGGGSSGFRRSASTSSLSADPPGMRRTESGMFMPEGEPASANDGIFGVVLDTVNTARDIAYVIWNVGWPKKDEQESR